MSAERTRRQEGVATAERPRTATPRRWKVLLHNDDFTTMEFVVEVLVRHFRHSVTAATKIMLEVHLHGVGVAGAYPREIAETKVERVTREARENGFPLLLTLEAET
jgi:ATP-dependent Clp protease adaptor protein ClpS